MRRGSRVRALVLHGDPCTKLLPPEGGDTIWSNMRAAYEALSPTFREFLSGLDMFYFGTASAEGQPYIQYRGGPPGFLKVVDAKTLGFADFAGNRQYVSIGNLTENPRAFLFLMDYVHAQRVKIWGRAGVVEGDPALTERLSIPGYPGVPERAVLFEIEAWDINCTQHIHRRYPASLVASTLDKLQREVLDLRSRLARYEGG